MLSLRTILLLCATVYLLPRDPAEQKRFLATASESAAWIGSTCDRHPSMCATASSVWQDLKDKAHFGGGVVYGLAMEQLAARQGTDPHAAAPVPHASGTLSATDLMPYWRGHAPPARVTAPR